MVYTKKHKNLKNRTVKKGGKSILGTCHIIDLPSKNGDGNVKVIIGRRRYYTKHFDINPLAKQMLREIANDPNKKNRCIAIARDLDQKFKNLKKNK